MICDLRSFRVLAENQPQCLLRLLQHYPPRQQTSVRRPLRSVSCHERRSAICHGANFALLCPRDLWCLQITSRLVCRPLLRPRMLIDQFHDMIRKKDEAKLDAWIAHAKASLVSSLATESLRTEPPCARRSRSLGQTARSKRRLRNSNSSNGKCMGARKLTFSRHDCSAPPDLRRRHQICVRAQDQDCRLTLKRASMATVIALHTHISYTNEHTSLISGRGRRSNKPAGSP